MANRLAISKAPTLKDTIKKAAETYYLKFGKHALSPNTAPVIGKKYIHLYHNGKKLCRYNILNGVIDEETKLVKGNMK
jgi:hypothetical protein